MEAQSHNIGQRLSIKNHLCTIRYVGEVAGKAGSWLGVEWDDPTRGKHDGIHDGVRYFDCRSTSPTAASFLRPTQAFDQPRSFLQALSEKYFRPEDASNAEIVFVSRSKQFEEVGFAKFARRQAELRGIRVLVLDHMRVRHRGNEDDTAAIEETCGNITDLDLSGNLFDSLSEILDLCSHLPKLRSLILDGNRFTVDIDRTRGLHLSGIRNISLSRTLLTDTEIAAALTSFPSVAELVVADNSLHTWNVPDYLSSVRSIDLSGNDFESLGSMDLVACPTLQKLIVKRNRITDVSNRAEVKEALSTVIEEVDLSHNNINAWPFFAALDVAYPKLKHLRVSGNPLFNDLYSAEGNQLTAEDGYMLTIARLPGLETLNYSKINDKERLNAETYYLNQIAMEASRASAGSEELIFSRHPRWQALCEEYGEPRIGSATQSDLTDPSSLAARLVTISFHVADGVLVHVPQRVWTDEIPKSFNIYTLYGMVGKALNIPPLSLRLIWETGEHDPVATGRGFEGPEWWDSSDDEAAEDGLNTAWALRMVELVPGTRPVGTYVEGMEATVCIDVKPG